MRYSTSYCSSKPGNSDSNRQEPAPRPRSIVFAFIGQHLSPPQRDHRQPFVPGWPSVCLRLTAANRALGLFKVALAICRFGLQVLGQQLQWASGNSRTRRIERRPDLWPIARPHRHLRLARARHAARFWARFAGDQLVDQLVGAGEVACLVSSLRQPIDRVGPVAAARHRRPQSLEQCCRPRRAYSARVSTQAHS